VKDTQTTVHTGHIDDDIQVSSDNGTKEGWISAEEFKGEEDIIFLFFCFHSSTLNVKNN
jgi:hypothetical protein